MKKLRVKIVLDQKLIHGSRKFSRHILKFSCVREKTSSLSLSSSSSPSPSLLLFPSDHQSPATSYRRLYEDKKKDNNNATDANGVKLDERARESRAIYIGPPIKVPSDCEHPAMEYYQ